MVNFAPFAANSKPTQSLAGTAAIGWSSGGKKEIPSGDAVNFPYASISEDYLLAKRSFYSPKLRTIPATDLTGYFKAIGFL
jgi:hypothetical protein